MTRKKSQRKLKIALPILIVLGIVAALAWYLHRHTVAVLEPAGQVGYKERQLMIIGVALSAIVLVPVYIMTVAIAMKYREENHETHKVKYNPDWDGSRLFESIWWGIPILIIGTLSVVAWNSSHALDPYKPLASNKKTLTVEVVAMDWKWLFIYPSQHIASVNLAEIPENTPVDFQITSDTVMNSFWIPQLGGQIYAMPGMSTNLNLMANRTGSFYGSPANIAGRGFARMNFTTKSVSQADFDAWVQVTGTSSKQLNTDTYKQLALPSDNVKPESYTLATTGLYNSIVMKYMSPDGKPYVGMPGMPGMDD